MVDVVEDASSDGHRTGFLTAEVPFRAVEPARFFREEAPATASARAYLRDQLPAIYQEQDFAMRFVGALEGGLDAIIGILDSLPAYFDGELAPQDLLEMLTAWLGIELDETQPTQEWRQLLGAAMELGRTRGTRRGLELILELVFPELEFRVADGGGITHATSPDELPDPPEGGFVVYCDTPVTEDRMPTIARVVETARPVHVQHRVRFRKPKAPKKPAKKPTAQATQPSEAAKPTQPSEAARPTKEGEATTKPSTAAKPTEQPKSTKRGRTTKRIEPPADEPPTDEGEATQDQKAADEGEGSGE